MSDAIDDALPEGEVDTLWTVPNLVTVAVGEGTAAGAEVTLDARTTQICLDRFPKSRQTP